MLCRSFLLRKLIVKQRLTKHQLANVSMDLLGYSNKRFADDKHDLVKSNNGLRSLDIYKMWYIVFIFT